MDLITKAIDEIKFRIPRQILEMAYSDGQEWRGAPISLDEQIRRKTIHARVLVDANIVGGETIIIPLDGIAPKTIDQYNYVFEIPPSRTNGRTIISVLSAQYMSYNSVAANFVPGTSMTSPACMNEPSMAALRAMNSRSSIPTVSNHECIVVGHNTVLIRNHIASAYVTQLRCVVANDERLSNISIRSAPSFSKLCEFAVKSYIYNELLIKIERGYLHHGQELGVVKSYIEGLSDAEENYQNWLKEEWGVVATINDRLTYEDLLRIQIDPTI